MSLKQCFHNVMLTIILITVSHVCLFSQSFCGIDQMKF